MLTVSVGSSVAPGTYFLTVDGSGTAGHRSTPLTLTVGQAGVGNVTVDFSSCPVTDRAVWLAAQNGAGAWTRIPGASDVYTFTIGNGGGGLAYVELGAGDAASLTVQYMTQAEFTAGGTLVFCPPTGGKTINGTVAGVDVTDVAIVSLGGSSTFVTSSSLNFQLTDVASGAQDLVAYRHSLLGGPESAIIRRGQDIADNGTAEPLDFGSIAAFPPATALITVDGLVGGEDVSHGMFYRVAANCATATLYSGALGGVTFTASGIPSGNQQVTDFHGLFVAASLTGASRFITQYFHTLGDRTVTLGAAMPTPTVTALTGPYKRLQALYTLPAEYQGSTGLQYSDGASKSVSINATFGYLGAAATTLALADYSGLTGWDNNWAPASSSVGDWTVSGAGTFPASACTEGASFKTATVSGTL